jgi:hypothetical protein
LVACSTAKYDEREVNHGRWRRDRTLECHTRPRPIKCRRTRRAGRAVNSATSGPKQRPAATTVSRSCRKRLKAVGLPKYQRDGDRRTSGTGFALSIHPSTFDVALAEWMMRHLPELDEGSLPSERPGRVQRRRDRAHAASGFKVGGETRTPTRFNRPRRTQNTATFESAPNLGGGRRRERGLGHNQAVRTALQGCDRLRRSWQSVAGRLCPRFRDGPRRRRERC